MKPNRSLVCLTQPRSLFQNRVLIALLIGLLAITTWFGTSATALAQEEEVDEPGVLVVRVTPDGPAAEAGLTRGSIILSVDGEAVNSAADLLAVLGEKEAGDEVEVIYLYGAEELTAAVTLGERKGRAFLGVQPFQEAELRAEPVPAMPFATQPFSFEVEGALVVDIVEESAAAEAGLTAGDVIIAVDGEAVADAEILVEAIGGYAPGDTVSLDVQSADGEERTVEVTLGTHADDEERAFLGVQLSDPMQMGGHGMVMPFAPGMGMKLEGVLVQEVAEDSPAAEAGLAQGDLIIEVNGEAVVSFELLRDRVAEAEPGDELELTVRALPMPRMMVDEDAQSEETDVTEETRTLTVTLGENEEGNAYLGISAMTSPSIRFERMLPGEGQLEGVPCRCMPGEGNPEDMFFFHSPEDGVPGRFFFHRLPIPGGEIEIEPAQPVLPGQTV